MNVKSTSQHLIKHSFVYALFCAFILFWSLHFLALPKITDKTVERISKEKPHAILFPHAMPDFWNPWNVPDNMPADYLYTITIDYHALQQTRFYLYPTGCVDEIRLNGTPINYDRKPSCSRDGGFAIDLAPVLRPGQNHAVKCTCIPSLPRMGCRHLWAGFWLIIIYAAKFWIIQYSELIAHCLYLYRNHLTP